ncbi:MAG: hypothetical protein HY619_01620 [Thaumarchaeota archaeon]|nr:hypothetical protein [Nitrososphaerota archaeon]
MYSKKPSVRQVKEITAKVRKIRKSIADAEKYSAKIGVLSAVSSLNSCGAIVDRLMESLSDALDAAEK